MLEIPSTKAKQRAQLDQAIKILEYALESRQWRFVEQMVPVLGELRGQMANRPPLQRGRVTADAITAAKRAEVWALRAAHPTLAQKEIAYRLNIDVGRVSEILHGKRT
jgi:hypothetical protein